MGTSLQPWYLGFIPPTRGGCCQPEPSNIVWRTGSSLHSTANRWLLPTSVKQYCPEDGIFHPFVKVRIHGHIFATMVFRPHSADKRWLLPTSVKQYCLEDPLKVRIHGHTFA